MGIIRNKANTTVYLIAFAFIMSIGLTVVTFKSKAETGKYFAWIK